MKNTKWLAMLFLIASPVFAMAQSPLVGTWALEGSENYLPGGTIVPYCTGAHGFIIYTKEGYVSVALNCAKAPVDEEGQPEKEPADATGRMYFYTGTYSYDGKTATHTILNSSELGDI